VKESNLPEPKEPETVAQVRPAADANADVAKQERTVTAYYFHGNVRCRTCKKIETYTAESITTSFTNELSTGRLLWKMVNVDEPENEHFVKDYALTSRSVVLVASAGDKQLEWKNLASIWDLVGDKEKFQKYINDETKGFLKKEDM
jgi:hypothetical protein